MNEDEPNDVLAGSETESRNDYFPLSSLEKVVDSAKKSTMERSKSDSERYGPEKEANKEELNGRNCRKNLISVRLIMELFNSWRRETATVGIKNRKKRRIVG